MRFRKSHRNKYCHKKKINHYICNECYFLFNKTNLYQKKIKYYKDNSDNKLVDRYLSNEYFDTARFLNYINQILEKYCNLDQQLNHLDIGGGFGFSKVLNKNFLKLNLLILNQIRMQPIWR